MTARDLRAIISILGMYALILLGCSTDEPASNDAQHDQPADTAMIDTTAYIIP